MTADDLFALVVTVIIFLIVGAAMAMDRTRLQVDSGGLDIRGMDGRCWHLFLGPPVQGGMRPVVLVIDIRCDRVQAKETK